MNLMPLVPEMLRLLSEWTLRYDYFDMVLSHGSRINKLHKLRQIEIPCVMCACVYVQVK